MAPYTALASAVGGRAPKPQCYWGSWWLEWAYCIWRHCHMTPCPAAQIVAHVTGARMNTHYTPAAADLTFQMFDLIFHQIRPSAPNLGGSRVEYSYRPIGLGGAATRAL